MPIRHLSWYCFNCSILIILLIECADAFCIILNVILSKLYPDFHSLKETAGSYKISRKLTTVFSGVISIVNTLPGSWIDHKWTPTREFGVFRIFEPSEWNLNLNRSDCRASKIIQNDIKLELIPWKLSIQNPILNFCVGVWVSGLHRANFSYRLKDAPGNFFDTNVFADSDREKMVSNEKLTKNYGG